MSSSQHDVLAIRARGCDPWNNVQISLAIEAVDINAHIFERLQNEVLEAVLLERVDHDSRREGRGERVVLGSGNRCKVISILDLNVDNGVDEAVGAPLVVLFTELEADRGLADVGSRLLLDDLEGVVETEEELDGLVLLLGLDLDFVGLGELAAALSRNLVLEDGRRVLGESHLFAISLAHVDDIGVPGLQLVAARLSAVDTHVEDLAGGELTLAHDAGVGTLLLTVPASIEA